MWGPQVWAGSWIEDVRQGLGLHVQHSAQLCAAVVSWVVDPPPWCERYGRPGW